MDTMKAFAINQATPNGNGKVFDWVKAAKILKERDPEKASAGLREDMEWTAGTIWNNHKPFVDSSPYLASRWATPVLVIDDKVIPCYEPSDGSKWDAETRWPKEALAVLD